MKRMRWVRLLLSMVTLGILLALTTGSVALAVYNMPSPQSPQIQESSDVAEDDGEEPQEPEEGKWWIPDVIEQKINEIHEWVRDLPKRLVSYVLGLIAFLILSLFRLADDIYLWLWNLVLNQTPLGANQAVFKLWAQVWWFSMGFLIIILLVQAWRVISVGESAANEQGYAGRKKWIMWLLIPLIAAVLSRTSLFYTNTLTRLQNVIWRPILISGIESLENAAWIPDELRITNGVRNVEDAFVPGKQPKFREAARALAETPWGEAGWQTIKQDVVKEALLAVMLPGPARDPGAYLEAGDAMRRFEMFVSVVPVSLALLLVLLIVLLIYLSQLVLMLAAIIAPIYFALSAAKRDPTPGAGWFGLVTITALVQSMAGILLRLLMVGMMIDTQGFLRNTGIVHLVFYALGGLILAIGWLLPTFNAFANITTLNGGAVIAKAGAFTTGVGTLVAAGGAMVGSQRMVRAGSNIRDTGQGWQRAGESKIQEAAEKGWGWSWTKRPGQWIAGADPILEQYLRERKGDAPGQSGAFSPRGTGTFGGGATSGGALAPSSPSAASGGTILPPASSSASSSASASAPSSSGAAAAKSASETSTTSASGASASGPVVTRIRYQTLQTRNIGADLLHERATDWMVREGRELLDQVEQSIQQRADAAIHYYKEHQDEIDAALAEADQKRQQWREQRMQELRQKFELTKDVLAQVPHLVRTAPERIREYRVRKWEETAPAQQMAGPMARTASTGPTLAERGDAREQQAMIDQWIASQNQASAEAAPSLEEEGPLYFEEVTIEELEAEQPLEKESPSPNTVTPEPAAQKPEER